MYMNYKEQKALKLTEIWAKCLNESCSRSRILETYNWFYENIDLKAGNGIEIFGLENVTLDNSLKRSEKNIKNYCD